VSRLARSCIALFVANGAAVILIWWAGLDPRSLDGLAGQLNAAGRVTALLGTYLVLVQLILRTHVPWLVTAFGKEPLKSAHTLNAYAAWALIAAHAALQLVGYALEARVDLVRQLTDFVVLYEGVLLAIFSLAVLTALTILSLDRFRHRVAWPLWRALHLFMYVAVALSVPHQLATGSDFVEAPLAVAYWTALLAVVALVIVVATVPRAYAGALARLHDRAPARRPHALISGMAAAVIGMYLIGTIRLAPDPERVITTTSTAQLAVAPSPAPASTLPPASATRAADVIAGIVGDVIETPYGDLQVRVFVSAGRIEDVEMMLVPQLTKRSRTISLSVDPWLRKRAIAAQSADFDVVSGATYTSLAYMRSLDAALRASSIGRP